jgi:predicted metallopeptidase
MSKAYGQMYGLQGLAAAGLGFGNGMIMEMISEDNFSGAKIIMNVREIVSNNSKSLDVSGYQIVGMGGAGQ